MKTNIKVSARHNKITEICRVKLDANKFPYIVLENEKIIISTCDFPIKKSVVYGLMEVEIDIVSGLEDLRLILDNPNLTSEKLSFRQQFRIA